MFHLNQAMGFQVSEMFGHLYLRFAQHLLEMAHAQGAAQQ
jgi:hypothetical protein